MAAQRSPTRPGPGDPLRDMMRGNMFYFYVLQSQKDGRLYYGFTADLELRMGNHVDGKVKSTKNRRPMVLVYYESYRTKDEAIRREASVKRGGRIRAELKERLQL